MNVGNSMEDIVEDAVQSLVSHLLSSSSSLPLKRLTSSAVTTSSPVTTATVFPAKSAVIATSQGSTPSLPPSSTGPPLIRVIRRPNNEPVSCPAVTTAANHVQPVIFSLPMGNPGGLLIVRNPTPETTVPVVSVSHQPAVAHSWSQFVPQPGARNSPQLPSTNHTPSYSRNFLLESPHVSGKLPADIYHHSPNNSIKNESLLYKPASLETSTFNISQFSTSIEAGNFNGAQIPTEQATELSGDVSAQLDKNKSSLSCDVLDDLLHIVNESLGPVVDDTVDTPVLPDYDDLTLDDDTSLMSMVLSPDSEVPVSTIGTARNDGGRLAKIMDYCPEWSYVEVRLLLTCVLTYLIIFISVNACKHLLTGQML